MKHLTSMLIMACLGACGAAGPDADPGSYIDLVTLNPGFEDGDGVIRTDHLPPGWERRAGPAGSQQLALGPGRDSPSALEITKTGTEFSAYHRIVNRLQGVRLDPGVPYILEFDYCCDVPPQGDVGIGVGVSSSGGNASSWDGTDDFIPAAAVQFAAGNTEAGAWRTIRLAFTPTQPYQDPCLLIAENYWANYPYHFRLDNFRLLVERCVLVDGGRSDAEIVIEAGQCRGMAEDVRGLQTGEARPDPPPGRAGVRLLL